MQRAAYMRIVLEDFEVDMDVNGTVEMFSQSDKQEPYERERPVARLYASYSKNYAAIIKQLSDCIKEDAPKTRDKNDEFNSFVGGRDLK